MPCVRLGCCPREVLRRGRFCPGALRAVSFPPPQVSGSTGTPAKPLQSRPPKLLLLPLNPQAQAVQPASTLTAGVSSLGASAASAAGSALAASALAARAFFCSSTSAPRSAAALFSMPSPSWYLCASQPPVSCRRILGALSQLGPVGEERFAAARLLTPLPSCSLCAEGARLADARCLTASPSWCLCSSWRVHQGPAAQGARHSGEWGLDCACRVPPCPTQAASKDLLGRGP